MYLNGLQKKVSKSHSFYLSIKYLYSAYHGLYKEELILLGFWEETDGILKLDKSK